MKSVLVVIPTQSKNIEEFKSCQVYESLNNLYEHYKFISGRSLDFHIVPDNKDGLSKVYNRFLVDNHKDKICVFCHDDIIIHSIDFVEQLNKAIEQFDIIGVAGSSEFKIGDTAWHFTNNAWRDKTVLSGSVGHSIDGKHINSVYGEVPKRCIVLDGVFLAVNVERALEAEWKFDEDFDFNFYDLASCLSSNDKKLKMGTWNIPITHFSGGGGKNGYGSPVWIEDAKRFISKYFSTPRVENKVEHFVCRDSSEEFIFGPEDEGAHSSKKEEEYKFSGGE